MSRENIAPDKIALLATGDEISNGDILNTNSQEIAQRLYNQGMHVGMHMTTPDTVTEIEQAIYFLLQSHCALIITGGLGPTSDDLTRYALGNALKRPLIFDETTWHAITERFTKLGYGEPPQSNRQQALFPQGATIITNPHGTAAGCQMQHDGKWIFMLPGPPPECLPMIETTAIPCLIQAGLQHTLYRKNWLLFGVSEGQIAEELDAIAKPFSCTTGYRLFYPYIEFKIYSNHEKDFAALLPLIEKTITPYLISNGKITASTALQETLKQTNFTLGICDQATGGLLEATLKSPENQAHLYFSTDKNFPHNMPHIVITGLDDFWQGKFDLNQTWLKTSFTHNNATYTIDKKIPFRGKRVKQYAVELLCYQINQFINEKIY